MKNKGISRKQLEKEIEKGILYAKSSITCKNCGHTMFLGKRNRVVCTWCGHYVFNNQKEEFEYRLRSLI